MKLGKLTLIETPKSLSRLAVPLLPEGLIAYFLPYKAIPVENFNALLDIMKSNPSLEKQEINNLQQQFLKAKDTHLGIGLFSLMTTACEKISNLYEQYFSQNDSSTNQL